MASPPKQGLKHRAHTLRHRRHHVQMASPPKQGLKLYSSLRRPWQPWRPNGLSTKTRIETCLSSWLGRQGCCPNGLSTKTRIETHSWENSRAPPPSPNGLSTKTRIETRKILEGRVLYDCPNGLSTKTRIETVSPTPTMVDMEVQMASPPKQGLKHSASKNEDERL